MTQEYQLETILAHAGINSDEATGALASPIHFFNNLPTSKNLAILLVLTIHELKIQHAQQWKKTLAAIEKADYAIATSSGMSAIVLAFENFPSR